MGLNSRDTVAPRSGGNHFNFISPTLAISLAALLSSCADVRPTNHQFGQQNPQGLQLSPGLRRITWDQWNAAQIKEPQRYPLHAGNPPQQHATPQKYPKKSTHSQKGTHHNTNVHATPEYTPEYKAQLVRDFGYLYNNPADAAKPLPPYAFIDLRGSLRIHTVRKGETFSGICFQNDDDRRVLSRYNRHIPNLHQLKPNDGIYIRKKGKK